jgi:5-methyltetrahydrofolate--homocysteine methyltransferase
MPAGVCPEMWCVKNPDALQKIHAAYQKAGSDIVFTFTFGANRVKLSEYGIDNARDINTQLALLAKRAVGKGVLVAGNIGPTGHFIEPFGDLSFD